MMFQDNEAPAITSAIQAAMSEAYEVQCDGLTSSHRSRTVPHPCQNGRKTEVTSGHSRASRTASGLGTCRLTPCLKRPSKQLVNQHRV